MTATHTCMRMSLIAAMVCVCIPLACADSDQDQSALSHQATAQKAAPAVATIPGFVPAILREPPAADRAAQDQHFEAAARAAWAQVERGYSPTTGLVAAQPTWA